jgi:hypothetical protein
MARGGGLDKYGEQPYNFIGGRKIIKSTLGKIKIILLVVSLVTLSCGIDDYPYLYPVRDISRTATTATITFPGNTSTFFRTYNIYYRIYISGVPPTGSTISEGELAGINSALDSDYRYFKSYTEDDDRIPNNMDSFFSARRYYPLELEDVNIDDLLFNSGFITFYFLQTIGFYPFLTTGGSYPPPPHPYPPPYYGLFRYYGGGVFTTQPNRYFQNAPDLYNNNNVSSTINADVAANTAGSGYTYVSLYIGAAGTDTNYSQIFSRPTFIGIFNLPNAAP